MILNKRESVSMATVLSVVEILKSIPKPVMKKVDIMEVVRDANIQIRFQPGDSTFGFETQFGDEAVEKLKIGILDAGRILTPLHLWERSTGKDSDGKETFELVALRGNQRSRAGQALVNDPNTPQAVVESLKKVDAFIYKGLTKDQAVALVDDQSSVQPYTKVDFVNLAWKLAASGMTYQEIGSAHARMYYYYVGRTAVAEAKLKEIENEKDGNKRRERIATWMRGGLDQGILNARRCGLRVKEAFLLTVAEEDGLIKEGMKKAEFNPKTRGTKPEGKGTDTRIAFLIKQQEQESTWEEPGSVYNQMIDRYVAEDAGIVAKEKMNRPTAQGCDTLKKTSKSIAMKIAYGNAAGEKNMNSEVIDNEAYRCEVIMGAIKNIIPLIKDSDVAAVLAYVLNSNNEIELTKQLEDYCK